MTPFRTLGHTNPAQKLLRVGDEFHAVATILSAVYHVGGRGRVVTITVTTTDGTEHHMDADEAQARLVDAADMMPYWYDGPGGRQPHDYADLPV